MNTYTLGMHHGANWAQGPNTFTGFSGSNWDPAKRTGPKWDRAHLAQDPEPKWAQARLDHEPKWARTLKGICICSKCNG